MRAATTCDGFSQPYSSKIAPWEYLPNVFGPSAVRAVSGAAGNDRATRATPKLRKVLYGLLDAWRPHSDFDRVSKCGLVRHALEVQISLRRTADKPRPTAQLAGLIKCRSKSCPVCLARRRSRYAEEIERTAKIWKSEHKLKGTGAYLCTLTIRHGWSHELKTTAHGVREAWRKLQQSVWWSETRKRWGIEYICAEELTHGSNGWHPHLHLLFLPRQTIPTEAVISLADQIYERWFEAVTRVLGPQHAPLPTHGSDLRPCDVATYLSKSIGLELADPGTKRGTGRTPTQLLQSWANEGDVLARELYRDYERSMRGRRDLTWSRGLSEVRARAVEELKEEAEQPEPLCELPGAIWDTWREVRSPHIRLLEAAESGGWEEVRAVVGAEIGHGPAFRIRYVAREKPPDS